MKYRFDLLMWIGRDWQVFAYNVEFDFMPSEDMVINYDGNLYKVVGFDEITGDWMYVMPV